MNSVRLHWQGPPDGRQGRHLSWQLPILITQFLLALLINLFLVFPLLGSTDDAAVMAAGFSGFTLGSTPTAMANMTAVTQKFGPSPKAFIVLPLVSAFFIDLLNAVLIPFFLHRV